MLELRNGNTELLGQTYLPERFMVCRLALELRRDRLC